MSCLESIKPEEKAYDEYVIAICGDAKFDEFLKGNYFTREDLWKDVEPGEDNEEAYNAIFDYLLNKDYEMTCKDPTEAARHYADHYPR